MRFLKVNQANVKASKAMSIAIRLEAISSRLEAIATRVEAMALKVKANKAIVCTTSKVTFCLALPLLVFMRTRHNKGNKRDSRTQTVVKESVLFLFGQVRKRAFFKVIYWPPKPKDDTPVRPLLAPGSFRFQVRFFTSSCQEPLVASMLLVAMPLFLVANLVTTSKALVPSSKHCYY